MTSFNDFGLAAPITRALTDEGYVTPTSIQADAMPVVLTGRDLIGIAQTGTGKTAAFALPILNRLASDVRPTERKACRVLVLSPTRELAGQIQESFRTYGCHLKLTTALAIGGVPMGKQVRALMNGVDVLVATPGRLLDLVRGNALKLNRIEVLVLDEADRMLDMGFIHDIRKIVAKVPAERQTLLFSATMPREIAELASSLLRDPARVAVTPVASTAERIAQRVIHTDRATKPNLLVDTLRNEPIERSIVFTRTKHGADKVVRALAKAGITAEAIHGNKSQGQRDRVMANFRAGRIRTLIATDIAARGIDVDNITHIINYDLPNEPESYVHRIGRTARAGAEGIAISFCDADEFAYLRSIEKLIGITIPATGEPPRQPQRQQAKRQNRGYNPIRPQRAEGGQERGGDQKSRGQRQQRRRSGGGQAGTASGPHAGGRAGAAQGPSVAHDGELSEVGFLQRREKHHRNAQVSPR